MTFQSELCAATLEAQPSSAPVCQALRAMAVSVEVNGSYVGRNLWPGRGSIFFYFFSRISGKQTELNVSTKDIFSHVIYFVFGCL